MNTGCCLCGAVRFELHAALTSPRYCHCVHCRKFTGTTPATWGISRLSAITLLSSPDVISRYNSGKGMRCFCKQCGSPVWFESSGDEDVVAIPYGILDEAELPTPAMRIFTASNPSWCVINDNLPAYQSYPEG